MKYIKEIIFVFLISASLCDSAQSQTSGSTDEAMILSSNHRVEYFFTISTIQARPQAIGGACMALRDMVFPAMYNPAGLLLCSSQKQNRIVFMLNPASSTLGFRNPTGLKSDSTWNVIDAVAFTGLFVKSIGVSWSAFEAILVLSEVQPTDLYNTKSPKFFNFNGILDRYSNILATKLQLAEQISIGASFTSYVLNDDPKKKYQYGSCYGIQIQPSQKFSVGLAYFDSPASLAPSRAKFDRIEDETINLGVSWRPHRSTLLSLDIRNVSEEHRAITREIHLGTEFVPFKQFAFRGGYYRKSNTKENVFCAGIGILSSDLFKDSNHSQINTWMLNYTFVHDDVAKEYEYRHYFSLLIKI